MKTSLTVFFEDPFWVGVFERVDDGKLSVCKVTFGAEPKDYDVWEFVLRHYDELVFSPAVETEMRQNRRQSQTAAQERQKANGEKRDRHEIPAGAPTAAGGNEDGTPSTQPRRTGCGSAAPV